MTFWRTGLGAVLALAAVLPAWARVERLDDSSSPRPRVQAISVTGEQGQPVEATAGARIVLLRFGTVQYRLATARYLGQQARIYYVVPALVRGLASPAALRVDWRSLGRFASGSARPGDRVLVWSGVVREPWMAESLELSMQLDLSQLQLPNGSDFGFESTFEIEISP